MPMVSRRQGTDDVVEYVEDELESLGSVKNTLLNDSTDGDKPPSTGSDVICLIGLPSTPGSPLSTSLCLSTPATSSISPYDSSLPPTSSSGNHCQFHSYVSSCNALGSSGNCCVPDGDTMEPTVRLDCAFQSLVSPNPVEREVPSSDCAATSRRSDGGELDEETHLASNDRTMATFLGGPSDTLRLSANLPSSVPRCGFVLCPDEVVQIILDFVGDAHTASLFSSLNVAFHRTVFSSAMQPLWHVWCLRDQGCSLIRPPLRTKDLPATAGAFLLPLAVDTPLETKPAHCWSELYLWNARTKHLWTTGRFHSTKIQDGRRRKSVAKIIRSVSLQSSLKPGGTIRESFRSGPESLAVIPTDDQVGDEESVLVLNTDTSFCVLRVAGLAAAGARQERTAAEQRRRRIEGRLPPLQRQLAAGERARRSVESRSEEGLWVRSGTTGITRSTPPLSPPGTFLGIPAMQSQAKPSTSTGHFSRSPGGPGSPHARATSPIGNRQYPGRLSLDEVYADLERQLCFDAGGQPRSDAGGQGGFRRKGRHKRSGGAPGRASSFSLSPSSSVTSPRPPPTSFPLPAATLYTVCHGGTPNLVSTTPNHDLGNISSLHDENRNSPATSLSALASLNADSPAVTSVIPASPSPVGQGGRVAGSLGTLNSRALHRLKEENIRPMPPVADMAGCSSSSCQVNTIGSETRRRSFPPSPLVWDVADLIDGAPLSDGRIMAREIWKLTQGVSLPCPTLHYPTGRVAANCDPAHNQRTRIPWLDSYRASQSSSRPFVAEEPIGVVFNIHAVPMNPMILQLDFSCYRRITGAPNVICHCRRRRTVYKFVFSADATMLFGYDGCHSGYTVWSLPPGILDGEGHASCGPVYAAAQNPVTRIGTTVTAHSEEVVCLAVQGGANGCNVVSGGLDMSIELRSFGESIRSIRTFDGHSAEVLCVAWERGVSASTMPPWQPPAPCVSPDQRDRGEIGAEPLSDKRPNDSGSRLSEQSLPTVFISGSNDTLVKIWDHRDSRRGSQHTLHEHCSPVVSVTSGGAEGRIFLSGDLMGNVKLWDMRRCDRSVTTLNFPGGSINSLEADSASCVVFLLFRLSCRLVWAMNLRRLLSFSFSVSTRRMLWAQTSSGVRIGLLTQLM
eukprot:GHVT01050272.1.p1 GENE.GHVT01050272.1~~GHVT01050272.1.p1  ORF type:complete len:1129 (+),score=117.22 GHVT01050272.1:1791-5177(+)